MHWVHWQESMVEPTRCIGQLSWFFTLHQPSKRMQNHLLIYFNSLFKFILMLHLIPLLHLPREINRPLRIPKVSHKLYNSHFKGRSLPSLYLVLVVVLLYIILYAVCIMCWITFDTFAETHMHQNNWWPYRTT